MIAGASSACPPSWSVARSGTISGRSVAVGATGDVRRRPVGFHELGRFRRLASAIGRVKMRSPQKL
jgi:hypothetical protein